MIELPIEEYFKYHPPLTEARIQKHNTVNETCLALAKILDQVVDDKDCKSMAMFALQQCRMFANQGITVDELKMIACAKKEANFKM
jgi:hypothetical protein